MAEQRRIHHVGYFADLEDQLCSFAAGSSESPDRLDAIVWAFTELMVVEQNTAFLAYYQGLAQSMEIA